MKLRVGTRIALGFGLLVLFLVIVGVSSFISFSDIEEVKGQILENRYPGIRAAEATYIGVQGKGLGIRAYLLSGDEKYITNYENAKKDTNAAIQKSIELAVSDTGKEYADTLKMLNDQYDENVQKIIAFKKQGNDAAAIQMTQTTVMPLMDKIRDTVKQTIELKDQQMSEMSAEINATIYKAKTITIVILIIAVIASLTIAIVVGRSITKPVAQVASIAQLVAGGDLRTTIAHTGKDEIGELAKTFNSMIIDLRKVVGNVVDASQQLAAASQELSSTSEETAAATEQVSRTVTEMASGASEQSKQVDDGVTVVNEMSAGIQQIATSALAANESAAKASSAALTGQDGARQATDKMGQLQKSTAEIAHAIRELGDGSKQVGQIVDVIKGIADQTNLLALNAAIEAARAGEQGRGFAVVAEEVRKLAEQSRDSAETIANLIGSIQTGTERAVDAMAQGSQEVGHAVKAVQEAVDSFALIVKEIGSVADQAQQVSAASQQMSSGSQQVVEIMERIAAVSTQAAASSEEVAASAQEQGASVEAVAEQASNLSQLAEQLQQTVSRFRV